jgi:predicted nucleotidyltransferase
MDKKRGTRGMRKTQSTFSPVSADPANAELLEMLEAFFKDTQGVDLVFLFGSMAAGRSNRKSDVDIGVLFKSPPPVDHVNEMRDKLSAVLRGEVDLVPLNHASPILKMQVLKNGVLAYAGDKKHFYQFFVDTINQYDDLKRVRRICEESILKGRLYA